MATQQFNHPHSVSIQSPGSRKNFLSTAGGRVGDFLVEYWAHMITIFLGLIIFAAIAVPFLTYFGLDVIAKPIFFFLHYFCAQIPSHSFYLFGHQLGLCARNFSIYAAMFVGSLIFVVSKKRLPGIPWWAWLLLILPMAIDGTTQMFGLRESNWILRVITGTLFGLGNVWFALPLMQKSLLETMSTPIPMMKPSPAKQRLSLQNAPFFQTNARKTLSPQYKKIKRNNRAS